MLIQKPLFLTWKSRFLILKVSKFTSITQNINVLVILFILIKLVTGFMGFSMVKNTVIKKQSLGGVLLKRCSQKFRKHLCQSLFFNKVTGLRRGTLLKKRLWHRCFPVNFAKFVRTSFFTEHLRWLLLVISPNFLVWKLCRECVLPQNFYTRKSGELMVLYFVPQMRSWSGRCNRVHCIHVFFCKKIIFLPEPQFS